MLFSGKRVALPEKESENYMANIARVEKLMSSYWLSSGNMSHLDLFFVSQALNQGEKSFSVLLNKLEIQSSVVI